MTAAPLQRKCACGKGGSAEGECDQCREARLQRKASRPGPLMDAPQTAYEAVRAAGRPLDDLTRAFMESRFQYDFSRVRVHADGQAAQAACSVKAEAYTIGRNIVFGPGRYAPHTRRGQRLLAHELTHVMQQAKGLHAARERSDDAEHEATRNEGLLHSSDQLFFRRRAPVLARKPDEEPSVVAPTGPPGCTLRQHEKIYPAAELAIQWLDRGNQRLTAFIAAPADAANQGTRDALRRHFHSVDPAIARLVLERLQVTRHDIDAARSGDQLTVECHTNDDHTCNFANAYVSGSQFVFCPVFFTWSLESRAESIVHEMLHTRVGGASYATDRGYRADRVLPYLSTEEALTNAESFGLLVQELGSGHIPATPAPDDSFARNCRDVESLVRPAIGRAQRWNRSGETGVYEADAATIRRYLGNDTPQIRKAAYDFYHGAASDLQQPLDFVCDDNCGARLAFGETAADHTLKGLGIGAGIGVGLGLIVGGIAGLALGAVGAGLGMGVLIGGVVGALTGIIVGGIASHGPKIHVCPGWKNQSDESKRIESILAAAYQSFGRSQADSVKYAQLAGALSPSVTTLQQIDRDWISIRLGQVRARLQMLRDRYNRSSDAFAASVAAEHERESLARGTARLHSQARADAADRELWGGSISGDRIRRAVTPAVSGDNVTLNARIQITYQSLPDAEGRRRAAEDIPRIAGAIRDVWQVTIEHGEYAGVHLRLVPSITYLPPGATRDENAFLIQVRGPDADPSSGDAPSGIVSLAVAHLQGARVIVVAHELAHLFGFVDTYLTMTQKDRGGNVTETLVVGRSDPRNRPDLLGDIDPMGLERARQRGAVTEQDVARQTGPVHLWEEEANIVLRTLGVAPPPPGRPAPDSENFDPQVELDRMRGNREAELARIRERRARIESSVQSVDLAEEIIRLEAEERQLTAQLRATP